VARSLTLQHTLTHSRNTPCITTLEHALQVAVEEMCGTLPHTLQHTPTHPTTHDTQPHLNTPYRQQQWRRRSLQVLPEKFSKSQLAAIFAV